MHQGITNDKIASLEEMIAKKAIFDIYRNYRYVLTRQWDPDKPSIAFIMLNPSTADENALDPTNRRVFNFAKEWGYGTFFTLNLFAYRTTDPKLLREIEDPIGKLTDGYIEHVVRKVHMVIAGWGTKGQYLRRDRVVYDKINGLTLLHCLKKTKHGHPQHPLYLKKNICPISFSM